MLINLWVRNKISGNVHQVGTERHDSVEYLDNQVVYTNMQSLASTFDDYEFVEPPDLDAYVPVTPDELFINKCLIQKRLYDVLRSKREQKKLLKIIKYPWGRLGAVKQYFVRLRIRKKLLPKNWRRYK